MRRLAIAGSALAAIALAVACQSVAGLGEFSPQGDATTSGDGGRGDGGRGDGDGGDGDGGDGDGGDSPSGGGDGAGAGAQGSSTSTSQSTATTSTGGGCTLDHLVISEVRTRGPDDGNQDFIELFNPTNDAIVLTEAFELRVRGDTSSDLQERWTGDGTITISPGGYALIANDEDDNPLGGASPDAVYDVGIRDGASIILFDGDDVVDAMCFTCGAPLDEDELCEGSPFARGDTCDDAGDTSVQRKPFAGSDGCTDSDDNTSDLEEAPSTPVAAG